MSLSNEIFGYEDNSENNEINIKFDLDYDKESELEQVINSTNEINISGSTSSDTPITSSSSSLKLSSNSNSATNSLFLSPNNHKLQFCSSNSSLNTSFYEMNQVIDLTKNEYLAKTSASIDIINNMNLNCETHSDIFLSNALSIDTSENFFKTIDDLTATTATTSTTSTNDTCDIFLNNIVDHTQQNILTNDFDNQYSHQTNDFNELLDKNFNAFVDNDMIIETHRISNHQFNFTNNDDQSSFTLSRPNCMINDNDYLCIPNNNNNNNKHDVSIGTDLSICRDIRCKFSEIFFEQKNTKFHVLIIS